MERIPQSVTKRVALKAYLSSDHLSDATGKTIAVTISKNGGAFGNPSGGATNATEIANGWYYVDLSTTDTGSTGPLIVRGTASGVDNVEQLFVVADAHNAGFDGVPSAAAGASGGLPTGDASGRVDVSKIAGAAVSTSSAQIGVNVVNLGGTAQTGRDIGASVLLSSGTGTGQLDFTSGVVKANLAQILGTALTETAGQIAAAFKQFFNIASPTSTMNTITAVTTATNLTNAPTSGDFTSTMKTSLNAATPSVTVSDKTGFSLASLDSPVLESGTAQAGASGSVTLRSGASSTDSLYNGLVVAIYGGTGAGQARVITGYVGSTKVASVDQNWTTNPDNTSTYKIVEVRAPKLDSSQQVTAASVQGNVTGSVGSVTGNVGGNVVGSVASVTAGVTVTTNNDKTGYGLSAAAVQAIWDALTSALTTVGSIGKLLVDNINATISSRSTYAGTDTSGTTTLLSRIASAITITGGKVDVNDKTGFSLTSAYDPAKTAAQAGDAMALTSGERGTLTTTIWDKATSALTTVGSIGKLLVDNINATISSRSTYAGGDTSGTTTLLSRLTATRAGLLDNLDAAISSLPSAASITTAVWAAGTRTLTGFGSLVSDIWAAATSGLTTVGSIGKLLVDNIDTAISSRSTYAGGDTSGTTTLLSRMTSGRASNLDNLDAAVSTRSTYAGADTSGTTTLLSRLTLTRAGLLDNLDAAVTTRLAASDYTAAPSTASIADAVWDEDLSGHATSGSAGEALSAAGSAVDPWATALPGSYGNGTAGKILGTNLDTTVSSRSSHSAADIWSVGTRTLTAFSFAVDISAAAVSLIWNKATSAFTTVGSIGKLLVDNIDAAISSRSIYAGTDTSGTTTLLSRLTGTRATNLDNLDVAVSTRLASGSYTAPDNAGITAIKAKTDNLPASPAATGDIPSASSIASAVWSAVTRTLTSSFPSVPTANQNADALLDRADGVETSYTLRQAMRVILAALGGKISGAGTTNVLIRDVNDAKDRIDATVDADGNRTAVTLDVS